MFIQFCGRVLLYGFLILLPIFESRAQERIIAKVDGSPITEQDMRLAALEIGAELNQVADDMRGKLLLEFIIDKQLFSAAAAKAKLDTGKAYESQMHYARRSVLRDRYMEANVAVSEPDARKLYDEQTRALRKEEEIRARHILVDTLAEATEIHRTISGGAPFSKVAQQQSKDTGSSWNGGDLGYFVRGQMTEEFEKVAFGLPVGKLSNPIKTAVGWHIIFVDEKRPRTVPPFEDVKQDLLAILVQRRVQELASQLRSAAKIEIVADSIEASSATKANQTTVAQSDGTSQSATRVLGATARRLEYSVITAQLNLRVSPDPKAEVLAKLDINSRGIFALGEAQDYDDERWVRVQVDNKTGWVNDRYLEAVTPMNVMVEQKPGHELDGESYRSPSSSSFADCMRACLLDDRCKSMEFARTKNECNLFSIVPPTIANKQVDAGIKRIGGQ